MTNTFVRSCLCLTFTAACFSAPPPDRDVPDESYPVPTSYRTGTFVIGGAPIELTYGLLGESGVLEGDIIFPLPDESIPHAAVIYDFASRWPGGIVTYRIDPDLPDAGA
jgi:hypothetical protein